jgi:hypothetical protein
MEAFDYPQLGPARAIFDAFAGAIGSADRVSILADGDADGIGAAVCLLEHLSARPDDERFQPLAVPKGLNAFTPPVAEVVKASKPDRLFVLDLGVRDFQIAPGTPTLVIDHHRPLGTPDGTTVLTGYGWSPVPTSSLLTYILCWRDEEELGPYAWKAAIGNTADLGPDYEPLKAAAKQQKQKWIKEALSLVNTAKRSSDPESAIPAALRALWASSSAEEIATGSSPDIELLRRLREEVRAELSEARRVGPKFSKTEPIAIIRYDSPARVQPLLAQSWRGRLPKFVVMAVNAGYMPGRVNFSLRTNTDANLLDLLARHGAALGIDEPEYGLGHDQATGGSLPTATFTRLIEHMGFDRAQVGLQ